VFIRTFFSQWPILSPPKILTFSLESPCTCAAVQVNCRLEWSRIQPLIFIKTSLNVYVVCFLDLDCIDTFSLQSALNVMPLYNIHKVLCDRNISHLRNVYTASTYVRIVHTDVTRNHWRYGISYIFGCNCPCILCMSLCSGELNQS
jgi:hypothetical protein